METHAYMLTCLHAYMHVWAMVREKNQGKRGVNSQARLLYASVHLLETFAGQVGSLSLSLTHSLTLSLSLSGPGSVSLWWGGCACVASVLLMGYLTGHAGAERRSASRL